MQKLSIFVLNCQKFDSKIKFGFFFCKVVHFHFSLIFPSFLARFYRFFGFFKIIFKCLNLLNLTKKFIWKILWTICRFELKKWKKWKIIRHICRLLLLVVTPVWFTLGFWWLLHYSPTSSLSSSLFQPLLQPLLFQCRCRCQLVPFGTFYTAFFVLYKNDEICVE